MVVLAIAVVVGVVFGVFPHLDLAVSSPFYDPKLHDFPLNAQRWSQHARNAARLIIALLLVPACIAPFGRLLMPRRRMLVRWPSVIFLIVTMALGPGFITNSLLKEYWGRARPIDVTEFGGTSHFTAWWDLRGDCPSNCSFIAGEPAGAFWTLAPASLAPPQWQALAYGAAITFGVAVGVLRIAGGGHFFSDVVFSGVIIYLLIWTAYGLIYRWWPNRKAAKAEPSAE